VSARGIRARAARRNELVRVGKTEKGRGLFALVPFAGGNEVCLFRGALMPTESVVDTYSYDMPGGLALVPNPEEIGGHLANHACDPNARVSGQLGSNALRIVATRAISEGEEITLYYGSFTGFDVPCLCRSKYCAGTIGVVREGEQASAYLVARLFRHAWASVMNRNEHALLLVIWALRDAKADGELFFVGLADALASSDQAWLAVRLNLLADLRDALGPAAS
jgi:SET domain